MCIFKRGLGWKQIINLFTCMSWSNKGRLSPEIRHCDLKRPLGNNTPHHQHIQSTLQKKKKRGRIGHSLILPFRVSINCVRHARGGSEGGTQRGREDEAVLQANERKFGWIRASSSSPCSPPSVWPKTEPWATGCQAKSDDNHANFYPATMYFTGSQWRKRPQSFVWEAPACVAPPFTIWPVAFPGLKQRLHIPNMRSEYWYLW